MRRRIVHFMWVLVAATGIALPTVGCGIDLTWPWDWDETCYDCRTVCAGIQGAVFDGCLATCHECQGSSACFDRLADEYGDLIPPKSEWDQVDCSDIE